MNNIHTATIPFYFNLHSFNMLLSYFPYPDQQWRGQLPATSTSAFFSNILPFRKGGWVGTSSDNLTAFSGESRIRKTMGQVGRRWETVQILSCSCQQSQVWFPCALLLFLMLLLTIFQEKCTWCTKGVLGHERYDLAEEKRLYTCCM